MKSIGLMVAGAAMFLAAAGLSACGFDSTCSTVKGDLSYVQDDLRQKPFKAIDVEAVADVYYTQNDGDECDVRLDYSAIKDAKFLQQMKEKLKVDECCQTYSSKFRIEYFHIYLSLNCNFLLYDSFCSINLYHFA